jgi:hypothetical protein
VVVLISDEEVSNTVHHYPLGASKLGAGGWSPVSEETSCTVPGNGRDDSIQRHFADTAVATVSDVKIPYFIHRNPIWRTKIGTSSLSVIPGEARNTVSCDRGNSSTRRHSADPIIANICNIEIPRSVQRYPPWTLERGAGGHATITRKTGYSVAGNRGNDSGGIHSANAMVTKVGNIHVSYAIERYAIGLVKARARGRSSVASKTLSAITGDSRNSATRGHPTNAVIPIICYVEIPSGVKSNSMRCIKSSVSGEVSIAGKTGSAVTGNPRDNSLTETKFRIN